MAKVKSSLKALNVPDFLDRPEVADFIGPNFETFKVKWLKDWARKPDASVMGIRKHWNLMALVFLPSWFGYRKMHKMNAVFVGVFTVMTAILEYYTNKKCHAFSPNLFVGVNLVLALMATNMYFLHVVDFFDRYSGIDGDSLKRAIEKYGRTSILSGVLWTLATLVFICGTTVIVDAAMIEKVHFCDVLTSQLDAATQQGEVH